jgi:hypothetical protein
MQDLYDKKMIYNYAKKETKHTASLNGDPVPDKFISGHTHN